MTERIVAASLLIILGFGLTMVAAYDKRATLVQNLRDAQEIYGIVLSVIAVVVAVVVVGVALILTVILGPFWSRS